MKSSFIKPSEYVTYFLPVLDWYRRGRDNSHNHKIYHFKVHKSVIFKIFTGLCNCHHLISEYSHHLKKNLVSLHFSLPPFLATTKLLSISILDINGII